MKNSFNFSHLLCGLLLTALLASTALAGNDYSILFYNNSSKDYMLTLNSTHCTYIPDEGLNISVPSGQPSANYEWRTDSKFASPCLVQNDATLRFTDPKDNFVLDATSSGGHLIYSDDTHPLPQNMVLVHEKGNHYVIVINDPSKGTN